MYTSEKELQLIALQGAAHEALTNKLREFYDARNAAAEWRKIVAWSYLIKTGKAKWTSL